MEVQNFVRFAIHSAEQCLPMWNKYNKKDTRVKEAIEAAKRCVKNPSKLNKSAAESAAWSAAESAWSATLKKILKFGIKILSDNISLDGEGKDAD